jgi:hypothetical protein
MTYTVNFTDSTKNPIIIEEGTVNTSLDVVLFGRVDLEYGAQLNEDMLHLLERFACPQDPSSTEQNTFPDYTTNGDALTSPIQGELWYNSTVKRVYVWNGTTWETLRNQGDVAANWGQILDGGQLPAPVDPATGYVYPYTQCIWAVSPASFPVAFTYMECTTDTNANVNMKYRAYGDNALTSGLANFLIIAIAGNTNAGLPSLNEITPLPPLSTLTPTPSPTVSGTPVPSVTPTISHSATPTPVATTTPTPTHTAAVSSTPAATHSPTPTPVPSPTPAATITPTPSYAANTCEQCTADGFGCCVALNSFLPDGKLAGQIKIGDTMILADQVSLEPATGKVSYSEPSLQPSVKIITKSGASLICSTTAPIPTTEGLVNAPDLDGKFVAVMIKDVAGWDQVVSVTDVGNYWVQHITVEDKCFWAGENSNAFILHHNIKKCEGNTVWVAPNCCTNV